MADAFWYRSWPDRVPEGRAYVVDGLPRLDMREQNYATLPDYQPWPDHDPGWFLLEWDVALDKVSRERFAMNALRNPHRVRVAPYWLHLDDGPRQVHRDRGGLPVSPGYPFASMFGLGCIYLPQSVLDEFWADPPLRLARKNELTDTVFSDWHRARYDVADVDWSVAPQHLHGD